MLRTISGAGSSVHGPLADCLAAVQTWHPCAHPEGKPWDSPNVQRVPFLNSCLRTVQSLQHELFHLIYTIYQRGKSLHFKNKLKSQSRNFKDSSTMFQIQILLTLMTLFHVVLILSPDSLGWSTSADLVAKTSRKWYI